MKYDKMTRRFFLQSSAGYIVSIPFLGSLLSKELLAQSTTAGSGANFVAFYWDDGSIQDYFYPRNLNMTQLQANVKRAALSGNIISEHIGSKLSSHKDQLLVLEGIDQLWHGTHCNHSFLTCHREAGAFPSIDQIMAWNAKVYPQEPVSRSVNIITLPMENSSGYYWRGTETISYVQKSNLINNTKAITNGSFAVAASNDPQYLFKLMFSKINPPSGGDIDPNFKKKKLVDFVLEDFKRVMNNRRISSQDKIQLDRHLNLLSETQDQLNLGAPQPVNCQAPDISQIQVAKTMGEYKNSVQNLTRLLAAALGCGLTKVGTIMLTDENSDSAANFQHVGLNTSFHEVAHNQNVDGYKRVINYFCDSVAEFMSELKNYSTPTGDNLLDTTISYMGSTMGNGSYHDVINLPTILAGGKKFLNSGYYIDYRNDAGLKRGNSVWGRPQNDLMITLMRAMGLSSSDYELVAGQGFGDYRNYEIYQSLYNGSSSKDQILPFVLK